MRKYSVHVTAQGTTQNLLYITWRSKYKFFLWQAVYNSNYTEKMFKIIIMKNDRVNIWCKYTLRFAICIRSMELFEFYSNEKANFFASVFLVRPSI